MAPPVYSGSTDFAPALDELLVDAFERIGIQSPGLTTTHIISARRSLNFILADWSANRGLNLWGVLLEYLPLIPGVSNYVLPSSWINVLDIYLRQYQLSSTPTATLGSVLSAITLPSGQPMLTPIGEVMVIPPTSGVFSVVAGSPIVTMNWPSHGQAPGSPLQFQSPVTAGTLCLNNFYVVNSVIDQNTLTFNAGYNALQTEQNVGGTPLFVTTSGSPTVVVCLINHGYSIASTFTVQVATTVGGITFPAGSTYTVTGVPNYYTFSFTAGSNASSSTVGFENSGRISIFGEQANVQPIDIIMYGLSRTEYASIPDKQFQARPTSFWFDRTIRPELNIWQTPPTTTNGGLITQPFALGIYTMQQIQDANPQNGQIAQVPQRYQPVLAAFLVASLAEKYRPELFQEKMQIAEVFWDRASREDEEHVPIMISPSFQGYYGI